MLSHYEEAKANIGFSLFRSSNIKAIKEFNKKNHNKIVIVPIKELEAGRLAGGAVQAKMFILTTKNIIEQKTIYIKSALYEKWSKKTVDYRRELELLTDDIFKQVGIEVILHARLYINPKKTLIVSIEKEGISYPKTDEELNSDPTYSKVLEMGKFFNIGDFGAVKENIGKIEGKAIATDVGYNINPL
jgi:hypothetical protein